MAMPIIPRDYQRAAIDATFAYFQDGNKGNPLIVCPTAAGKSIILAKFIEETLQQWSNQRVLLLAHRKELLAQNCEKLLRLWPDAPVGIYSAGLKKRELGRKITIAGIQSVHRRAKDIGWIDLVIVDECHLIPSDGEGTYRTLIAGLQEINPNLRIIGLTATPFRLKTGSLLDDDGFFTDIAYEIHMAELIKAGFLSPLISKMPKTQANLSQVHIRGGEYVAGEAEAAMDQDSLTQRAIDEMETHLEGRKSWLIFCAGIDHAYHVAQALKDRGHTAEAITGESDDLFRAQNIENFKRGTLKCLVNCDVLTTGFDAPNVDALVMLRPTQSVGLYIQIVGRGSRISPETLKENCIVLDFAGNIDRHGPVDAIRRIRRKASGSSESSEEVKTERVKPCPECRAAVPRREPKCPICGYVWPVELKHEATATDSPILASVGRPKSLEVSSTEYKMHSKVGKPPSMKVTYTCTVEGAGNLSTTMISEWVCLEHMGYAFNKAVDWWKRHHEDFKTPADISVPLTVMEALERTSELRPVSRIFVTKDGNFERIVSVIFATAEEIAARDELPEIDEAFDKYGVNI